MNILISYFLLTNLIGFVMCAMDKRYAVKKKWRIPEKKLFIIGILGGALGVYISMIIFRHKTKHWYFVLGMPLIVVVQIIVFVLINYK